MSIITVNKNVINKYSLAIFGSLIVKNVVNKKQDPKLNERKKNLQKELENNYKNPNEDEVLQSYVKYFKKWNKSYPIEYQIKSVQKGKNLPNVSVLVDSMFHAELQNRILTSGHNLDEIAGNLEFNLSTGQEQYIKIDGNAQQLKQEYILLHDEKDILANMIYGPAKRSTIKLQTKKAQYIAWCPDGIHENKVKKHLEDLLSNLELVFGAVDAEIAIL